ncbi:MAG: zinc-binding dehydrogenase [Acidimicrobiales bacterium]
MARGEVRVPVAAEYPMSEAEAAYARFTSGDKFGKVVLVTR